MTDAPRLLGRTGGTTNARAWAMRAKDGDGRPEPERVDKDTEERLAEASLPLSDRLRERARLVKALAEQEIRLRWAIRKGQQRLAEGKTSNKSTLNAIGRSMRRKRKQIADLDAEIGRLQSERKERAA